MNLISGLVEKEMNILIEDIFNELKRAEEIHPSWPIDKIHAVAIIIEKVGAAMKEALDIELAGLIKKHERLDRELIQSAAMCIRALIHIRGIK